ncbi:AbgT family transporter [Alkalibacterium iburiense]|uniref:AbgT family transporter n=1 Tax=Alkalibacterium iburiense TaxID=290589 RepID=A0ABN0XKU0_9LACT
MTVSFIHPETMEEAAINNLMSRDGFQFILTSMLDNFVGFTPLGIVLTLMLGIGVADKEGLLETFIKHTIVKAPKRLVTYAVVFAGVIGNIAGDASFVIIPPLAAMVFYNLKRHPLAGLAAGFAGAGAGFTANIIIANTDVVISGISTDVMQGINPDVIVTPVDNWYFLLVSALILPLVGAWITEKVIEPRLGTYEGEVEKSFEEPSPLEVKGLRNTGMAILVYLGLLVGVIMLPDSPLRNDTGGLVPSPLISGIVPILTLFFIIIGVTYGITVGSIKKSNDVPRFMGEAIKDLSGFIVLIFAAAQFIAYFEWSNMGTWLAVTGANYLQSIGLTGLLIILVFILFTGLLNLLIFSGAAQWALQAPVFLHMFYLLGYHPAFIQAAFRIADSSTNILTPMNTYFIIILGYVREYDEDAGLGTLISLMLPYSLAFFAVWIVLFFIFALLGLPFGPGIGVYI